MSYPIIAYIMYVLLTVFVIVYVGRLLHRNGRLYILALVKDERTTDQLNALLLIAYCLFNIGYAFIRLRYWPQIPNVETLVSSLSRNVGVLILILACTHYLNMLLIAYYFRAKNISVTLKRFHHE